MMTSTQNFLLAFFQEPLGESESLLVWTLPDKRSAWFRAPARAASYAARLRQRDVYFAANIFRAGLGPDSKGKAGDVIGATALFADLDFAGPAKKSDKPYPPDQEAVLRVLEAVPYQPSIVWNTGGGLQAAWLLQEVEWLGDDTRGQVAALSKGWNALLGRHARALGGWTFDSVGNLDRVLRLPGSLNHKPEYGTPRPVEILTFEPHRRYLLDDFRGFVDVAGIEVAITPLAGEASLVSRYAEDDIQAEAARKISLILDFEAGEPVESRSFTRAWNRVPVHSKDVSQSAYDWRFMHELVKTGLDWTPDELAAALCIYRHACAILIEKTDPRSASKARAKGRRLDYLDRTVRSVVLAAAQAAR